MRRVRSQSGSSLIEVLVAMLILAIGLIGFAGLQAQALRMNYETLQRTRASALAEELFDRMRSNRYLAVTTDEYERAFNDPITAVSVKCDEATCTPSQMAIWDLNDWLTNSVREVMGDDIDANISRDPNGKTSEASLYAISIRLVEVTNARNNEVIAAGADDPQLVSYEFKALL
jgi:type IV pilus assembly protein PilV